MTHLAIYSLLIIAASIAGGLLPGLLSGSHRRMQLTLSCVSGFMIGVAMLHLLPHALEQASPHTIGRAFLAGLLGMFLIERFFAFHEHESAGGHAHPCTHGDESVEHANQTHANQTHANQSQANRTEASEDKSGHTHDHTCGPGLHWAGAAIGMTLHSLAGGLALASAVTAGLAMGDGAVESAAIALPGLGAFLVIVLHKPLDALTVMALARASGMSRRRAWIVNGLFALAVPVGALIAWFGLEALSPTWMGAALAFSAGTFLCIALSDVLPELHFHDHDRLALSLALIIGVALAAGVEELEHRVGGHAHSHEGHANDGHDHSSHQDSWSDEPIDPHAGHNH